MPVLGVGRPAGGCHNCSSTQQPTTLPPSRLFCLPPCSVLDAWVKGSVLTSGTIFLENTLTRRQSRQLTLDSAAKGDAKVLAGPINDGWYHIQVGAAQAMGQA